MMQMVALVKYGKTTSYVSISDKALLIPFWYPCAQTMGLVRIVKHFGDYSW